MDKIEKQINQAVAMADVFSKLTKDCDKDTMDKIVKETEFLTEEKGKSLSRALADALEKYNLAGSVK